MVDVNYCVHGDKHFDPEAFIGLYKNFLPDDSTPKRQLYKFIFDSLQKIFEKGEITGDRLLDIGSGPVCHNVYAASRWFRDISLSDISEANLNVLRSWKAGERRVADPVLRYMISLDGERTYLKPGGHVIDLDCLGCNWYKVGNDTFQTASLKNEEVISAYKECGYDIISWKERTDMRDPSGCGEMTGCFALVGRKR